MFKIKSQFALSLALLVGVVGFSQAEMTHEEYAIKFRRSGFTVLGWYYGLLYHMAKGEAVYDKILFARNAEYLALLSKLPRDGFIPGTETGDTKAKPEIWSKSDKFIEAYDHLVDESSKLAEVSKSGNFDAIKEQFGKVQKTCKACHDDFKKKAD